MGTGADELPRPKIALMWVPLSFGNPEIEKNHPNHFWPGEATSTGSAPPGTRCTDSSAFHTFYSNRLWRSKPFAFAEWGIWGADVPGFVGQFFGFLKSHPRVRMAVYYQSASLKPSSRSPTIPPAARRCGGRSSGLG